MAKKTLQNWQGTIAVMGADWGDSGKGRMIDELAKRAHIVARYGGGSNTGHTVENEFGKFGLHIVPSGIFSKNTTCLVGRNVAIDLESLVSELEILERAGVQTKNLIVDEQASLTMPWHKMRDGLREKFREAKVGTTGRGVGPTYADRTERIGLLVKDLLLSDLKQKIEDEVKIQNRFWGFSLNTDKIFRQYFKFAQKIRGAIGNTTAVFKEAAKDGKNILLEGAQGYFLDIDAGTYPFVTSSNPGVVGIWRCFDIHPSEIDEVVGITKAYITRVGEGPMPTKIDDEVGKYIVEKGNERGTTTGRERTVGWLDLVLLKEAVNKNKINSLAITKLDVLCGIETLKMCVGYSLRDKVVTYKSHDAQFLASVEPVYEEFPGWSEDISSARSFSTLPKDAKAYIKRIEEFVKTPVKFISVGPKRGEAIYI